MNLHLKQFLKYAIFNISILYTFCCLGASHIDVGIITALHSEATPIISQMKSTQKKIVFHIPYYLGTIDNKRIVVVTGGVGDINAAVSTAFLIRDFNPKYIIFSGSAGGVNKKPNIGDVVISKYAYLVDFGNPISVKPAISIPEPDPIRNTQTPLIFYGNKTLLKLIKNLHHPKIYGHTVTGKIQKAKITIGSIATSEYFPDSKIDVARIKKNNIDALEMEGAAVLKTCWIFNKPNCLVVRGISDLVQPVVKSKYVTWNESNQRLANNNAAQVVIDIIKALKNDK